MEARLELARGGCSKGRAGVGWSPRDPLQCKLRVDDASSLSGDLGGREVHVHLCYECGCLAIPAGLVVFLLRFVVGV